MTAPVPTHFSEQQIETIDRLEADGVGVARSEVIRRAVDHLADTVLRSRIGQSIADSYRQHPETDDDAEAMVNCRRAGRGSSGVAASTQRAAPGSRYRLAGC